MSSASAITTKDLAKLARLSQFREGKTTERVRIHYATLGSPQHNGRGDIDNAVLVLHLTGADGAAISTAAVPFWFFLTKPLRQKRSRKV